MAFTTDILRRCPWTAQSLVEDREQHLRLLAAGVRVAFAHEAAVRQPAIPTLAGARRQQLRWDAGRLALARRWGPRLVTAGFRRHDAAQLHAAFELLVPPQSLLLAAGAAGLVPRETRRRALAALAGQTAFVLGGLALVRAPAPVWRALALAPALAADKLVLLARPTPRRWNDQPRRRVAMRRS
jgi:hypothetical protein